MAKTTIRCLLLALASLMASVEGLPPVLATAGTPSASPAVRQRGTPRIVEREAPRREVLLAWARCSEDRITLDFKATGNALAGLLQQSTQGNIFFFSVSVEGCPDVLAEIRQLAEDEACTVAPNVESSFAYVCDDERNAIIDVVGSVLTIAFSAAPGP